jgi:hypothetical protein
MQKGTFVMQEKHSEPTATMSSSWRDVLKAHPAANKVPEASDDELQALASEATL